MIENRVLSREEASTFDAAERAEAAGMIAYHQEENMGSVTVFMTLILSVLVLGGILWQRLQGAPNYAVVVLLVGGVVFEAALVALMIASANPTLITCVKLLSNGSMILLLLYLCFLFRPPLTKWFKFSLFLLLILEVLLLTDSILFLILVRS